ncbi:alpha/beta hydrolase [Roseiconus lacunae]|uniref:alpha/beta hydrolase n=1 Tax=Roseiconus lacunae TaxID=2605694 RepID=UPI0011F1E1B6|nr:alpha/beta hydrolase [Roseiconus lacunae]MCD0459642.1 alpha/beta hydrolase [Roseiconus lacunae]WRQ49656.1 alpha/beta hydrolase [Stieleria sp. HD01]
MIRTLLLAGCCALSSATYALAAEPTASEVVKVWPESPPSWTPPTEPEADQTKADGRKVADRHVIRLGNVSTPQLHVFPAKDSKTTVIICPGGGFSILAWDLEGTEIASWLQDNGISAAVLKYRVPTRSESTNWVAPAQDLQRSVSLIRSGAIESLPTENIGVLGFSAGGHTVVRGTLSTERLYEANDDHDQASARPDFAALIYPAYLTKKRDSAEMDETLVVTEKTPPFFFAHAFDDPLTPMGSVGLFAKLKAQGIPSSLHVFSSGGHGFGGRDTGAEKDAWLPMFKAFLQDRGF